MPPTRRTQWVTVGPGLDLDSPVKVRKKAWTGSGLRTSTAPSWDGHPEWSRKKPTRKWGKKCVERWCLLPPYDTRITEKQWKAYYDERSALEKINTMKSEESEAIISEELYQNTWKILRKAAESVAATILGSKLDDGDFKKRIARTLIGSLYFTELSGCNEEDETPRTPRTVDAKTRLYSPFGIGTSLDFHYDYHYRLRLYMEDERCSTLDVAKRTIDDCKPENPGDCAAAPDPDKEDKSRNGYTIFLGMEDFVRGYVTQYMSPTHIETFEELLFGCTGWLSPRKLVDLLLAAGTVMHYHEFDTEIPEAFKNRFEYFQGEKVGKHALIQERALLARLEAEYENNHKGEEVCVPQRLLLLARHEG